MTESLTALRSVNQILNRELETKRKELEKTRMEISYLNLLLSDTVKKLELLTKENKRLKYAENEFKRLGVIEERDYLLEEIIRLKKIIAKDTSTTSDFVESTSNRKRR